MATLSLSLLKSSQVEPTNTYEAVQKNKESFNVEAKKGTMTSSGEKKVILQSNEGEDFTVGE